jgi:hypothetical protein
MQRNSIEIKKAISKKAALAKALNYLRDSVPSEYPSALGAKFSSSGDGKYMTVSMPAIGQTANSIGREVWNGKEWKFEFVFYVGQGESRVEVFRFYLNDEVQVENMDEELFGSIEGVDFLNYVCGEVYVGALNSSLFAATPTMQNS